MEHNNPYITLIGKNIFHFCVFVKQIVGWNVLAWRGAYKVTREWVHQVNDRSYPSSMRSIQDGAETCPKP